MNVFYEELNLQKIVQRTPYGVSNVLSFACDQVIFVLDNVQNLTVISQKGATKYRQIFGCACHLSACIILFPFVFLNLRK